jgi:hypothetical protein
LIEAWWLAMRYFYFLIYQYMQIYGGGRFGNSNATQQTFKSSLEVTELKKDNSKYKASNRDKLDDKTNSSSLVVDDKLSGLVAQDSGTK